MRESALLSVCPEDERIQNQGKEKGERSSEQMENSCSHLVCPNASLDCHSLVAFTIYYLPIQMHLLPTIPTTLHYTAHCGLWGVRYTMYIEYGAWSLEFVTRN